jgi:filamentous hemagglutinin family protein
MIPKSRPAFARRTILAVAVAASFASNSAFSNPTGPTVVNGTAAVVPSGSTLNITNSPNAIINWQRFSIGAGETTRFIQQNPASAVLNRVTTANNPSAILGTLQSNGRVFLVNPSGILFGNGAQVDVAGLVASTLNLSNEDFLAGRLRFTETPGAGGVLNVGNIATPEGGQVYLVGSSVTNGGVITSPRGEVILAAGNSVELINPGTPGLGVEIVAPNNRALNLGEIVANAGRIGIFAGLIRNSNLLQADAAEFGDNGEILLRATRNVTIDPTGQVVARTPGGAEPRTFVDITAGGNVRFNGPANAENGMMNVTAGGNIRLNDPISINAHYVNLRATTPGTTITEGPDGGLLASRILDITANGDVILPNALNNGVNWVSARVGAGGDFRMNVEAFLFPEIRGIELTGGGDLELNYRAFDLNIARDVSARRIKITNSLEFGNITISGSAGAQVTAPGPIDISSANLLTLQGHGVNFDAVATVEGGGRVRLSSGGDMILAGGPLPDGYALVSGRRIDLKVGGTLQLLQGTAPGAFARIQSPSVNQAIRVNFPNLAAGGYFVNGVEGAVADGLNGIYTGNVPAVPGQTLLLEYGQQ